MRGLCWNVPQVEDEEVHTLGSSCERTMSKCAIG